MTINMAARSAATRKVKAAPTAGPPPTSRAKSSSILLADDPNTDMTLRCLNLQREVSKNGAWNTQVVVYAEWAGVSGSEGFHPHYAAHGVRGRLPKRSWPPWCARALTATAGGCGFCLAVGGSPILLYG